MWKDKEWKWQFSNKEIRELEALILNNPEHLKLFFEYFVIQSLIEEENMFTDFFYIFISNNFNSISEEKYRFIIKYILWSSEKRTWLLSWSTYQMRESLIRSNEWLIFDVLKWKDIWWYASIFVSELITYIQVYYPRIRSINSWSEYVLELFDFDLDSNKSDWDDEDAREDFVSSLKRNDSSKIKKLALEFLNQRKWKLFNKLSKISSTSSDPEIDWVRGSVARWVSNSWISK